MTDYAISSGLAGRNGRTALQPARRGAASALRAAGFAVLGLLALLGAGFAVFVSQVERYSTPLPTLSADGIVVLTGGQARIETGVELMREGRARRLLISGVHPDNSLGHIRRAIGAKRDVFGCCVDIDKLALDTVGNAEQAAGWARRNGFRSLIVVTSYYHMPRSLLEMERKLPGIEIRPQIARLPSGTSGWLTDSAALRIAVPEYLKYLAAVLRLGVRESESRTALASAMAF